MTFISGDWYRECNSRTSYGLYLWTAGYREGPGHLNVFVWKQRSTRTQYGGEEDGTTYSPMNYVRWNVDQPDNARGNERCVNIWPNRHYEWNDEPCHHTYCFVCENRNTYLPLR